MSERPTQNDWQKRCTEIGFEYWRAPDAHGVICTTEQAVELLQEILGVEVEIKSSSSHAQEVEEKDRRIAELEQHCELYAAEMSEAKAAGFYSASELYSAYKTLEKKLAEQRAQANQLAIDNLSLVAERKSWIKQGRDEVLTELSEQEPVASTNKEQLGYLLDERYCNAPMAMWNAKYSATPIKLYAHPPIREGWVMVPSTPSMEQCVAGASEMYKHAWESDTAEARDIYKAMIAISTHIQDK